MTDADIATIQARMRDLREYALGVSAHKRNEPFDANRSEAWQQSWLDACGYDDPESTQYYCANCTFRAT